MYINPNNRTRAKVYTVDRKSFYGLRALARYLKVGLGVVQGKFYRATGDTVVINNKVVHSRPFCQKDEKQPMRFPRIKTNKQKD